MEFNVSMFRQEAQAWKKTLDTVNASLRQLSKICSFYDADTEIKVQIIQKCQFSKVLEKGLS